MFAEPRRIRPLGWIGKRHRLGGHRHPVGQPAAAFRRTAYQQPGSARAERCNTFVRWSGPFASWPMPASSSGITYILLAPITPFLAQIARVITRSLIFDTNSTESSGVGGQEDQARFLRLQVGESEHHRSSNQRRRRRPQDFRLRSPIRRPDPGLCRGHVRTLSWTFTRSAPPPAALLVLIWAFS